ncbi:MAG: HD domain-containing protein [Deltaproteobacteria bacterium]|nr:HD domain-containing protein [Deltaproteobacteria bacterium]OQY17104.1 MAG: phosphohydrolase [Desulfobacterium sp. 4572_20]HDH86708.1 HD domain-containing protein [Desulfobacteraceae bacterium]MBW2332945.1 HD domain-containing protein [Deltaproteobacteria bacterium]MCD6266575.1 HD domain-containing protein [Deltaproteobacteria bacterium]
MKNIVNFLFEIGILKKTPRSGFQFLGTGNESVAEHSFRAAVIAYLLAKNEPKADMQKVVLMSLFHDFHEARTGDHNYVNKRYVTVNEDKAVNDLARKLPFGKDIVSLIDEFNSRETLEAQLSQDADQLDFILELKRQQDLGNISAAEWLKYSAKRLITDFAKSLADEIVTTDSSDWWFEKKEELWVNGPNEHT